MTGNEDDFVSKFETERSDDGYGLVMDKGSAEKQEMAEAFDAPDVGTMEPEGSGDEEGDGLALGDGEEAVESASAVADAAVVVTPIADAAVASVDLPAAEDKPTSSAPMKAVEQKANDMDSQSFGQAFKHFRNKGASEFKWRGKSYSTALKNEVKPAAAKAEKTLTPAQKLAVEVFDAAPSAAAQPAPRQSESTSGIGPKLNPRMQPKPGASGIYDGVTIRKDVAAAVDRSKNAKVAPMTVAGEDGNARPAQSVAELVNARKASGG